MTLHLPRLAAATLIGTVSLGLAAPALAQDRPADEATGERCLAAVDRRLDHLTEAQRRLDGVEAVTDEHEATIDALIDATRTGLTELRAEIDGTAETETLRDACRRIAEDFRVYLVVVPQARLAVAADRGDHAVEVGATALARLDDAIARAEEAGADVGPARVLRDEAADHLAEADAAGEGVADAVLAVTPAAWNDGPGAEVLDDARDDLGTAHTAWRDARDSARAAVAALRDAMAGVR